MQKAGGAGRRALSYRVAAFVKTRLNYPPTRGQAACCGLRQLSVLPKPRLPFLLPDRRLSQSAACGQSNKARTFPMYAGLAKRCELRQLAVQKAMNPAPSANRTQPPLPPPCQLRAPSSFFRSPFIRVNPGKSNHTKPHALKKCNCHPNRSAATQPMRTSSHINTVRFPHRTHPWQVQTIAILQQRRRIASATWIPRRFFLPAPPPKSSYAFIFEFL
jgi:hypothetical protein